MLVETDINELGDKRLSPPEAVARETEELLKIASTRKIAHQDELEDPERSSGPKLYYTEILRRLRNISPHLKVLDGAPGNVALFFPKRLHEYDEEGRFEYDSEGRVRQKDPFFYHYKYVGGMSQDYLPEYAHVTLDTSNLPVREIRGWRSVLIRLIKEGAITYSGAVKEFGEAKGKRSSLWKEQLQDFKR
jgi:hypothetical protein